MVVDNRTKKVQNNQQDVSATCIEIGSMLRFPMLHEIDRLRNTPHLRELLGYYANREAWTNRLMQMDGVEPKELVTLHGDLIAFDWAEMNIGQTPNCYRITRVGRQALEQVQVPEGTKPESALPEKKSPSKASRPKRKTRSAGQDNPAMTGASA
jgi:hypothetical protein